MRFKHLAIFAITATMLSGCAAQTQPAEDVTQTSATLYAQVDRTQNEEGVAWFEYREASDTGWTKDVELRFRGAAVAGAQLGRTITGLSPGTTYQYRLCSYLTAPNQAGSAANPICLDRNHSVNGDWDTFTTTSPSPPPSPPRTTGDQFPNPSTTGTPPGWTPATTRTTDLHVTEPGAVISDVLLENADISVEANNVTLRRVELQGGVINNFAGPVCHPGLTIEDSTIGPAPGRDYGNEREGVISYGGYTADGVEITHRSEGFRASSCGPVIVRDSYALITPPQPCGDWHGDGLQGNGGHKVTVRNVTLVLDITGCGGTAPFFVPANQGNDTVDIDHLLVQGGGYPFRLGVPGPVKGLRVVNNSWAFGPIDVKCSVVSPWEAKIVNIDANYAVTSTVRDQPCNTESGT